MKQKPEEKVALVVAMVSSSNTATTVMKLFTVNALYKLFTYFLTYFLIVIAVFSRPSFRAIVSVLWCLLVLFHSCSYLCLYFIM